MERLLLPIPLRLTVTTKGHTTTSTVNPGVQYWLDNNDTQAVIVCDPTTPNQCSIQFVSVWSMVQFKLQFGIDSHPKHGGIALKLTRRSAADFKEDRSDMIRMMQSESTNMYFRLKKQHGWWQLACPILTRSNTVYWKSWMQMGFTMRTMKHRFDIEELVELAHELRQIYVDAPIKMVTSHGEIVDVTDLEPVVIQLMH